MAMNNVLYLAVLPLIRIPARFAFGAGFGSGFSRLGTPGGYGPGMFNPPQVEQFLTLFPDRELATEFFRDEVDRYVNDFLATANEHLRGGHVKGYTVNKLDTDDGRIVVQVLQNVE